MITDIITLIILGILAAIGIVHFGQYVVARVQSASYTDIINELIPVIRHIILYCMADAEATWEDYKKTGELKKSQVITKIYEMFPELSQVLDQEKVITMISDMIEAEMGTLEKIIEETGDTESTE